MLQSNLSHSSRLIFLILTFACKVLAKISSRIYSLSMMAFFCNQKTLRNIYFTDFHFHLSFRVCLFLSAHKNDMNAILRQQLGLLRILSFNETSKEYFKNHDCL